MKYRTKLSQNVVTNFILRRKQSIESKDMISLVFVMGQNIKEQEVVGINSGKAEKLL